MMTDEEMMSDRVCEICHQRPAPHLTDVGDELLDLCDVCFFALVGPLEDEAGV
jgi:hypothetical protein